ncbi:MAG: radical SAM protein [Candidatus Nealsonbacteria bacterium]|nr:radical SAM protein [Candidatus Nealsonbacteria bacterium]
MHNLLHKFGDAARSFSFRRYGNVALNLIERRLRVTRPWSYPLLLDIVLTKACNLNCTFCISSTVETSRWLDFHRYERIARRLFPYARNVSFCSGGEPLLYSHVRDALRLANRHRVKTLMVSNGMLLEDEVCRWMTADQSLRNYYLSFDGSTRETVERIRRGASFDRIVENVTNLHRHKTDARVALPRLGIRYSVMKQNVAELPGVCKLAKSMGASSVVVSFVNFANEMDVQDSLYREQDLAAEVFAETRARAAEHGITVELPPLPRDDGDPRRCVEPWRFVQIDTDGTVRFCYRAWVQTMGRFDEGFGRVWRGEQYANVRATLDGQSPYFPYCQFCSECRGTNNEAAHDQRLHAAAYSFDRAEPQLEFNNRGEENRLAFKARRQELAAELPEQPPAVDEPLEEELPVR